MIIVMTTIGLLLAGLVSGWAAATYVLSYTALIALLITGKRIRYTVKCVFRPKLYVYLAFLVYVVWDVNIINNTMIVFSAVLIIESATSLFQVLVYN